MHRIVSLDDLIAAAAHDEDDYIRLSLADVDAEDGLVIMSTLDLLSDQDCSRLALEDRLVDAADRLDRLNEGTATLEERADAWLELDQVRSTYRRRYNEVPARVTPIAPYLDLVERGMIRLAV